MIQNYLFLIICFFFLEQTSDNFLYWEDIDKEKQNSIIQSKYINKNVRKTYCGTTKPSDDELTRTLLDTLSNLPYNEDIKAFYFYVFNNIIQIADGTLAELIGVPCLNIFISNSEYVIFYLQDKPKILKKYAWNLGYEFYFKEKGTSDIKYNYATFKKIVNNKIENDNALIKTFSIICSEIDEVIRNMD